MGGFAIKFNPGEVAPIEVGGALITHDNAESKQLPKVSSLSATIEAAPGLAERDIEMSSLPGPDFTLTLPIRRRLVHLFKASRGLSTEWLRQSVSSEVGEGDVWVLGAHQPLLTREMGITDKLPSLDVKDRNDRNKGDAVVKLVAPVQIIWFVLQLACGSTTGCPRSNSRS
ncbi:hypothetical protein QBC43DRAFT_292141 [Cladorrhinum sp. PSN259]|nr:hypothetical protein QBC43DRAFT_292141 [Cladorrhinum sp. PSN259]